MQSVPITINVVSSNHAQERCTILCDKVCQWFTICRWFSPGTPVSSTNKTDRQIDITEILLKVALNNINQINQSKAGSMHRDIYPSSSVLRGRHSLLISISSKTAWQNIQPNFQELIFSGWMPASLILNFNSNEFWDVPYQNVDFNSVYRWHMSSI